MSKSDTTHHCHVLIPVHTVSEANQREHWAGAVDALD